MSEDNEVGDAITSNGQILINDLVETLPTYENPYKEKLYTFCLNYGGKVYADSVIDECDKKFYDSNLVKHAEDEFKIAGWLDDAEDDSQKWVCENLKDLLATLASQGHSGMSAPYVSSRFSILSKYGLLTPLTGKEDEWVKHTDDCYQNNRCSHVFKNSIDGEAYDLNGKIFREPNGSCFTNSKSRTPVTFPYTPESIYVDVNTVE